MTEVKKESLPLQVMTWIDERLPVFTFINQELVDYPTPKNLNYFWNFGSLAGIVLVVMILSGLFLAMSYTPHANMAFESVERIMRDINYGWLIRYIHMNGASMFFIVVYIHMFRGLYYGSYKAPRELLWILGVVILLLMMATAFMGYVLPWGQMSFWGATVITNLFSAFPLVGESIVTWLWGGFAVDNPTLNRFFALHFLLPFVIIAVVMLHLIALHQHGSNNPLGIDKKSPKDSVPFHPYYTFKDLFGLGVLVLVWSFFVFFFPNFFGEPDNYIPANPLITPVHIVPEWYFLPFYAILRAVPSKLGGVLLMFGAIFVLFLLPWLDGSPVRSAQFRPLYKWFFWFLLFICLTLGWVGGKPPEGLYMIIARGATAYYFFHFLVLLPLLGRLERPLPLPQSIHEEYTRKKGKTAKLALFFWGALPVSHLSAEETPPIPQQHWPFQGMTGTFDRASLQRGFQVYKEVCAACHGLKHIRFRELAALGFSKEEIKALAATYDITDGLNDEGEMFQRKGRPSDAIPGPYKNDNAARAANSGALPPDQSLIIKARPDGTNYMYALLTGFQNPPSDVTLGPGMYYNRYFPGHQIVMAPPLSEGLVTFSDGTQATVPQMARDVTTFLSWAAEPEMEARKALGVRVIIFMSFFTVIMYFVMRRAWRRVT